MKRVTSVNKTKVKGKANEALGESREKVGNAIGNDEMASKGQTQQTKGKIQSAVGGAKGAIRDKLN